MDETEPVPVMMTATCHTPDCPMDGVGCVVPMYANAAEPIYRAQCGRCGEPVTDLVPA